MLFDATEQLTKQSGHDCSNPLLLTTPESANKTVKCSVGPTNMTSVAGEKRHSDLGRERSQAAGKRTHSEPPKHLPAFTVPPEDDPVALSRRRLRFTRRFQQQSRPSDWPTTRP